MLSISNGLSKFILPSTPSIKINGEPVEPLPIVPAPRIDTEGVLFNCPPLASTPKIIPGTNPCKA